ncbi:hypothetical protein AURANDRAFT_36410 [Aureococcus anophagefferens]|uniref:Uncharacterized protein n=1 Tax=Aureococcus anophagefferens TaxID=44056 RepID=F0XZX4_AURAN|nr:hypothetical protein AURANDRAFT_36410 [Aureococcus anophagefferens]EGB11418.1 hypothetical protein AURANDRAFT_36410 [Aureococcus anophagefferens]|eukprot:XP_009033788.1 hypothetical protein AURANDRAFT_36410 [Aureococcus anophagefferens]
MAAPSDRNLPRKEADLFKSIVKFYETKQYKKGLKASDAVLRKFPNHGETLAMRGLVLNCLERKEEAYDYVKKGLKADMRSHVCWHVYGLLYRSDRQYPQAIKSYKQALKIDPDNVQILRDLSLLQVQLRDGRGFLETRRKLLQLKPNNKMHWVAYALSNHLAGLGATAIQVIDAYGETIKNEQRREETAERSYEDSELALYRNSILEEEGRYGEALAHLAASEAVIVDKYTLAKKRAELLLLSGPQARDGAAGLAATATPTDKVELTDAQVADLDAAYALLAAENPKSEAYKWVPLTYASGASFEGRLDDTIKRFVRKGAPAIGSGLERLWCPKAGDVTAGRPRGAACCRATLDIVDGHVAALRLAPATFKGDAQPEPPTSLLWCLYLKCHCHEWLGELEAATKAIDECLEHTPTSVDFREKRARLLKRGGAVRAAAAEMVAAREMDLADRYINNKATKYLLRAGDVAEARKTAAMFTRPEAGDAEQHLNDMQASWYELEVGLALGRDARKTFAASAPAGDVRAKAGLALKLLLAVEKHFADFIEDQFDFHTYCVRKMTLRAYVSVLRFEDGIRGHKFFRRAAKAAGDLYVLLADADARDSAAAAEAAKAAPEAAGAVDAKAAKALAKREKAKQRKAAAKEAEAKAKADAEAEAAKKAEAADGGKKEVKKEEKREDDDPDGAKLAAKAPLDEALRLSEALRDHAAGYAETHELAFDVALRRQKPLMALRALRKLEKTAGADAPALLVRLAALAKALAAGALGAPPPAVAAVLDAELAELCGAPAYAGPATALAKCRAYAQGDAALPKRVAAARALSCLGEKDANLVLTASLAAPPLGKPLAVACYEDAHAALLELGDAPSAAAFKATAAAAFPAADYFADN